MALSFGTSGVRGLATEFTWDSVFGYTEAFYQVCIAPAQFDRVAVAYDLRASSPEIFKLTCQAFANLGVQVLDCGELPTPALAVFCRQNNVPGVMITGSHIPADRNGLKFYLPELEILKSHEQAIQKRFLEAKRAVPTAAGLAVVNVSKECRSLFVQRYTQYFSKFKQFYLGQTVLVFEHSSVARDVLCQVLKELGFHVVSVGRSQVFVPVDTEAMSTEGQEINQWLKLNPGCVAIVSTDGDGDRPFIASETGQQVRGDLIGLITARFLGVEIVVTPVSSTTSIEKSNVFKQVIRTKIGSPYVLDQLLTENHKDIASGFEANGGFILGTQGLGLEPLLTRDSVLPILCTLTECLVERKALSLLVQELPQRFNDAGLVKGVEPKVSQQILSHLDKGSDLPVLAQWGQVRSINKLDGLRFEFMDDRVVHFRPSGNAPEFRVYSEAESEVLAKEIVSKATAWLQTQI